MDSEVAAEASPPAPWLFGVVSMPYGCFNGLIAVALPYLLRQRGLSVGRIASVSALIQMPTIWYFLWAPIVDLKLQRRTWILGLSVASGVLAAVGLSFGAGKIAVFTACLIAASVFSQPISSAVGGLVPAVMPDRLRGRTGGWSQAGILGGGIALGGLTIWLTDRVTGQVLAVIAGASIALPAAAVLLVREPRIDRSDRGAHIRRVAGEMRALLQRREVWVGVLYFVSPIGAGALMNLFSAVGSDFHASNGLVLIAVSIAGVLTPIGALVGGILCDRYDRHRMYAVGGLLAAASVAGMLMAPLTPATYLIGAAAYAIATGWAYATFMALAYSLLGRGSAASGTQFTFFMAIVNIPVVYMLHVDGLAHAHFGVRGMLAADGVANLVFGLTFLLFA